MQHPRHSFTPCTFKHLIYLAKVTNLSITMESFDPKTDIFLVLPVFHTFTNIVSPVASGNQGFSFQQPPYGNPRFPKSGFRPQSESTQFQKPGVNPNLQPVPKTGGPSDTLAINSVAFVINGELCLVIQNNIIARLGIELEKQFRISTTITGCWSSQPPLIVGGLALIANAENGQVMKFDLKTYAFI
jgi:hypothetical protein